MILITGASRGIGKFLYEKYKADGEIVYGTTFSRDASDSHISKVDVSDYAQIDQWIESLPKHELKNISLINCAGMSYASFAHKSDPMEWRRVIEVNLLGSYHSIRRLLPSMREQAFGRIICFSSVVAEVGVPGTSAYSASKAALWGLVKTLSMENAPRNVTANCINLGYAAIGMGQEKLSEGFRREMIEKIPAKRFCSPQEIYLAVELLRCNAYINGTAIDVNGGLY